MDLNGMVGPATVGDGTDRVIRLGKRGQVITADGQARYFEASSRGTLFVAHAIVTAPVIWSTAAATGGPLIWNGSAAVDVNLIALSAVITTASTVAGALGITGTSGQTAAPTSTTAIDSRGSLLISGGTSQSTPYRLGTPAAAGGFFLPVLPIGTNAVTAQFNTWTDIGGAVTIPPNCWASVAGSATLSTLVAQIGLVYEEIPR